MQTQRIPSQCPECAGITVEVTSVPPSRHDRGEGWATRAECERCGEFVAWFE